MSHVQLDERGMDRRYTLLTGATGQIGRFLLRDLLLLHPGQIAVLVRPKNGLSGEERIRRIVGQWAKLTQRDLPMPICLEGNTTLTGFGLAHSERRWLRENCDTIFHNAASIDFSGRGTKETWNSNLAGAQHVIEICNELRVDHLAYTSTAYVCGTRQGTIYEHELEMGQEFQNEYVHSKYEAERIVRGPSYSDAVTILRPAIVVGDYHSGRTFSYHSFYRAVQFTAALSAAAKKDELGYWPLDVRLALTGKEISNFVTVDWVSSAMANILSRPGFHGKTYHLTPSEPTTISEIQQALQEYFRYTGVKFAGPAPINLQRGTRAERRFHKYMEEYFAFWGNEPRFDRTETNLFTDQKQEPRVDVPCLIRLADYAIETRFGKEQS